MTAGRDVRCVEFVELVTEWMEGALDDIERADVEEHVAICPECTIYLAQLRDTIAELHHGVDRSPSDPARQRLLAEFRRWTPHTDEAGGRT